MSAQFGATSTTDEVLGGADLGGKRFLVTGVSAGLGVETARVLVAHGAEVVGTVRDQAKGHARTDEINKANGGRLSLADLDLASLASVRACADRLLAAGKPFDGIICNAGIMACPQAWTTDGHDLQFGTNHLAHFLLVNKLQPLLRPSARVVMVSSSGHRNSDVNLDDPDYKHTPYDEWEAYGRSKTGNILFAVEFDRRHKTHGVRATALHPGAIATELARHVSPESLAKVIAKVKANDEGLARNFFKTVPQGAATSIWCAVTARADEVAGRYCEDCNVAKVDNTPGVRPGVMSYALDASRARVLWTLSEELVGEQF